MGTMDEVTDVKADYLRDYEGDRVKAAIMFCRDSLPNVSDRADRHKRRSMIELAQRTFELSIYQRAIVEEHV